jgi:hypothetical protein
MSNEIEKLSPEDVATTLVSFNDPNLVLSLFRQLGWGLSFEIKETLSIAQQNINLGAKLSAIKHLRTLLREAAEAAGYYGKVTQTISGGDGTSKTFSAKQIANALKPAENVSITERKPNDTTEQKPRTEEPRKLEEFTELSSNDKPSPIISGSNGPRPAEGAGNYFIESPADFNGAIHEHSSNRGRDSSASDGGTPERNSGNPTELGSGQGEASGCKPHNNSNRRPNVGENDATPTGTKLAGSGKTGLAGKDETCHPCIQKREPSCDRNLFPGACGPDSTAEGV